MGLLISISIFTLFGTSRVTLFYIAVFVGDYATILEANVSEAYLEPCQTSLMEPFHKNISRKKLLNIFAKNLQLRFLIEI